MDGSASGDSGGIGEVFMGSGRGGVMRCVFCGESSKVGDLQIPMKWECPWCNGSALYDGPWRSDKMGGLGPTTYWRPSNERCAFRVPEGVMLVVNDFSKEAIS